MYQHENTVDFLQSLAEHYSEVEDVIDRIRYAMDPEIEKIYVRELLALFDPDSAEPKHMGQKLAKARYERVTELGIKLAKEFLAIGNEKDSVVQRIEFKGGRWPDNETNQGGMNFHALVNYFTGWLSREL